jgi:hypothetical protein
MVLFGFICVKFEFGKGSNSNLNLNLYFKSNTKALIFCMGRQLPKTA